MQTDPTTVSVYNLPAQP